MAHPDANIIFGSQLDENLEDTIRVTVVATGLGEDKKSKSNDITSMFDTSSDDDESFGEVLNFFRKD